MTELHLADTPTSPILSHRSPVPKSVFSMVIDICIVQRVGSADWYTHHHSVLDSNTVLSVCMFVQSIGLILGLVQNM